MQKTILASLQNVELKVTICYYSNSDTDNKQRYQIYLVQTRAYQGLWGLLVQTGVCQHIPDSDQR